MPARAIEPAVAALVGVGLAERQAEHVRATPPARYFEYLWPAQPGRSDRTIKFKWWLSSAKPTPASVRCTSNHPPVETWVGEAIAVGGTLAGAALGVCGSLVVSSRQRANSIKDRMRDAFGVYLGALYPAVAELRELPDVGRPSKLARLQDRVLGETATFVATRRRERATFGDRPRDLAQRVGVAVADLQVLPLPGEVRAAIDAANDYVE